MAGFAVALPQPCTFLPRPGVLTMSCPLLGGDTSGCGMFQCSLWHRRGSTAFWISVVSSAIRAVSSVVRGDVSILVPPPTLAAAGRCEVFQMASLLTGYDNYAELRYSTFGFGLTHDYGTSSMLSDVHGRQLAREWYDQRETEKKKMMALHCSLPTTTA